MRRMVKFLAALVMLMVTCGCADLLRQYEGNVDLQYQLDGDFTGSVESAEPEPEPEPEGVIE